MTRIGLRELKFHTGEIMQMVEEEREVYEVTLEGEPVAVLEPASSQVDRALLEELWAERRLLARDITKHLSGKLTVAEAVSQQRRGL